MNPSTAAAHAIVDALLAAGVREVVLCPGSRSAPIAYAVRSAERAGRLRLHVRVDERSAGFLALGLGKRSGVPAVVVTTSGTAVANLHPAVLEAHHAHVPLIVLSADRPAELRGTGANQTTIQPGIFAGALRAEVDLEPWTSVEGSSSDPSDPSDASNASDPFNASDTSEAVMRTGEQGPVSAVEKRSVVADLVDVAMGRTSGALPGAGADAGPVHVNVQFREPLVPELGQRPTTAPDDAGPVAPVVRPLTHTTGQRSGLDLDPQSPPSHGWPDHPDATTAAHGEADRPLDLPERTLVVLGDLPRVGQAEVALAWSQHHGLPVVAEPFGPYPRRPVVQHGVLVLGDRDFVDAHEPECVVVVGRPTLSRPVSSLVRRPGVRLVIVESGPTWSVPGRTSERVAWSALTEPTALGGSGAAKATPKPPTAPADEPPAAGTWAAAWLARGEQIEVSLVADPPPWPSGAAVVRALGHALPTGALLFVGSSNPPRDLDTALGPRDQPLDIVASRGLAGIDGCVSSAIGLALAEPGRPAYALMGDLTFLHDASGLLIGPAEPRPDLTIVVVNDDGGGIFQVLEPGEPERAADFERLFGTPTRTDLEALCRAHGIRHTRVESAVALASSVAAQPNGISVVEVPASRTGRRDEAADLRSR